MEEKPGELVRVTEVNGEKRAEVVTFPSLDDALDAMFSNAFPGVKIRPFREFRKEYEARERIERSEDYKAYELVKGILSSCIDVARLSLRLYRGNASVLLDGKVSNLLYRFYFKGRQKKYITVRQNTGKHERVDVNGWEDISLYAEKIKEACLLLADAAGTVKSAMGSRVATA